MVVLLLNYADTNSKKVSVHKKNCKKFLAWRSCYYGDLEQQLLYVLYPIDRGEEIYLATIMSVMVGNKLHIGEKGGVEERKHLLHT